MSIAREQPVSTILSIVIKYNHREEYELWLRKIRAALLKQKGFLGIEVIRPSDVTVPEYFILLRFENFMDLETWRSSKTLAEFRKESERFVVKTQRGDLQYGTEMFFSRPLSNFYYPKPPFWKQVIIGILTVYPIIFISSNLLKPIVRNFPQPLALFLSICIVSPLMIFTMPKVSRLFKNWLYPIRKYSSNQ